LGARTLHPVRRRSCGARERKEGYGRTNIGRQLDRVNLVVELSFLEIGIDRIGSLQSSMLDTPHRGVRRTVATNCSANVLHAGRIGFPKKRSTKARKNDEDIIRVAASLASTDDPIRFNSCSERM